MSIELLNQKRSAADVKSKKEESEEDDDDEEYEVEKILDKKVNKKKGGIYYLIKWKNWSDKYNSWEPYSNVKNCLDLVEKYEFEHSHNQKSNSIRGTSRNHKMQKKSQLEDSKPQNKNIDKKVF